MNEFHKIKIGIYVYRYIYTDFSINNYGHEHILKNYGVIERMASNQNEKKMENNFELLYNYYNNLYQYYYTLKLKIHYL